jgi:hypothetical protein
MRNKAPNKTVVSPKAILKLPATGQVKTIGKPVAKAMLPAIAKPGIHCF